MTCAEARRQLPGPDGSSPSAVLAHLSSCLPCRAEAEALREIDRRLQRLGTYQALSTPPLLVPLDRLLGAQLGDPLIDRERADDAVAAPAATPVPAPAPAPAVPVPAIVALPQVALAPVRPAWLMPLIACGFLLLLAMAALTWVLLRRH